MDNQTKIIMVLLALILVLAIIFGLKITGIIKPAEKEVSKIEDIELIEKDYTNDLYKIIEKIRKRAITVTIIVFIINLVLTIGIAKLYRKISMPQWIVLYQYLSAFISLLTGFLPNGIEKILSIITGIISIIIMVYYFSIAGMSKIWAICPILIPVFTGISVYIGLNSVFLFGLSSLSLFSILLLIAIFALLVAYLVAHIIANIRIADGFNKGIVFKIGIAILPGLFQAILGYQRDYKVAKNLK